MAVRQHGRTAFGDLEDLSGSLQLLIRVDELGEGPYSWLSDLDPGDIIGAEGTPIVSRRGEPSLLVRSLTLLAKAVPPPPEKFHGLQDVEERLRRRYVDLLSSPEARARFRTRTFFREIRRYFDTPASSRSRRRCSSRSRAGPRPLRSSPARTTWTPSPARISIELP